MRKKILLAIITLVLVSVVGYANTFSLKGNYFVPSGPSSANSPDSLWKIEYDNKNKPVLLPDGTRKRIFVPVPDDDLKKVKA